MKMGLNAKSIAASMTPTADNPNPHIPHLKKTGAATQLIVDGKPFLILGGELQNSSLTSARYMEGVWQKMVDTSVNTLLGCVTWEDIEPEEGEFNFSELEEILGRARTYGMRLVLLWFGSFKNGTKSSICRRGNHLMRLLQDYPHTHRHGSKEIQSDFLGRSSGRREACFRPAMCSLSFIQKGRKQTLRPSRHLWCG